jgi:hypothetical protein
MKYKIQIDGLRFYAVVSVLIGHWIAWDAYNPIVKNTPWGHGVILFFVLSGFLITNILLNQKEAIENKQTTIAGALKTFYIRRFFRIFPIYYFLIFFLYYINYPKTREIFLWLLTYTSNIYQGITNEYVGHFNHFWSLAVEEQFYIFWPLLIFIVPKKHLMSFFTSIIIISFLSRMWCLIDRPEDWMLGAYFTPNLLLPLVLGAILALIKQKNIVFYYNFFKPVYGYVALIIYAFLFYYFTYIKNNLTFHALFDEYLFSIVSALFVAVASVNGFSGISEFLLTNKFSNHIGKISYGVYLIHLFIPTFFWDVFTKYTEIHTANKKTAWFFYFLICFTLATIINNIIEKPINKIKDKFNY